MGKRVVIMAGGTGGHVFPALAVADYLRGQGHEVSWMGTHAGLEADLVPKAGFPIDWLSVTGFRGKNLGQKIKAPLRMVRALCQAHTILRARDPQVVLGMGGFVSAPGGLMASFLRLPLVIHEQNRVPGSTSRLLARRARRVLQAFPDTFPRHYQAVTVGNPLRKSLMDLLPRPRSVTDRPVRVLVLGGSQGAKVLNETVPPALARLAEAHPVDVLHQTGAAMIGETRAAYRRQGMYARVETFIEDMAAAYEWADLAICRAGAMTVSELMACGLPAVLVPYPYAIDNHQFHNARYLADSGGAILYPQNGLTVEGLAKELVEMVTEPNQLALMSQALRSMTRLYATVRVAEICMEEARP